MTIVREETIGDCRLIQADCLEVLPTLEGVDAVVTDPPYGIGESNERNLSRGNAAAPTDYGHYAWDAQPVPQEAIDAMQAVSRWQVVFGGNYYSLPPTSCWLVWDKLNGDNDFADCELAWTNLPKAVRRIYWRWNGMIRKGREDRVHPTQKPLGVMQWAITHLPDKANTICDPYMGSGTTGVACVKLGRSFIGIEIDPGYFDIAVERIREAYRQPDMFTSQPASKPTQLTIDGMGEQ
jgi:site-specific DNA-methyltransferase (adenine-specific)/modification methylase